MKFFAPLILSTALLVFTGCGGNNSEPRLPTFPVKGKLLIDGKPFGPCLVYLSPSNVDPDPAKGSKIKDVTGIVSPDGSFELMTYQKGDGAPAGTYNVSVQTDVNDIQNVGAQVPVCKPFSVTLAKPADGKPLEIELTLDSTGQTSMGAGNIGASSGPPQ